MPAGSNDDNSKFSELEGDPAVAAGIIPADAIQPNIKPEELTKALKEQLEKSQGQDVGELKSSDDTQASLEKFGTKVVDQPPKLGEASPADIVNATQQQADSIIKTGQPAQQQRAQAASVGEQQSKSVEPVIIDGGVRNPFATGGKGPHFFKEQEDSVFFPDVLIYVCGANVSPHIKGQVTWSYGINDSINTLRFTLDNSHDKFTLTPENLLLNQFNTLASDSFREFGEAAKAKVFFYKDNQLPSKTGKGVQEVNTPRGIAGRRFPLNFHATVFHRMDPVRAWVRWTPFDEWIPIFAGFITSYPMSDSWVDHVREVSITAQDMRVKMRRMRVQRNTVPFQLPGYEQITEARAFRASPTSKPASLAGVATEEDPTGTFRASEVDKFWADITRGAGPYTFAWANMSYRQVADVLTVGGTAPTFQTSTAKLTKKQEDRIKEIDEEIKRLRAQIENLVGTRDNVVTTLTTQSGFTAFAPFNPPHQIHQNFQAAVDLAINTLGEFSVPLREPQPGETRFVYAEEVRQQFDGMIASLQAQIEDLEKERRGITAKKSIVVGGGGQKINGIGRMGPGRQMAFFPNSNTNEQLSSQQQKGGNGFPPAEKVSQLEEWYSLCLFGSPIRVANKRAKSGDDFKPDVSTGNLRYWQLSEIIGPDGAGERCRNDDLWAPDNQLVHWLLPAGPTVGTERQVIVETQINQQVGTTRTWTTRFELLNEFSNIVDYYWWVTGTGDFVFEFPMYDFDPQVFGSYDDVLTVDGHAVDSTLEEEAGEPPTVVVAVGSHTGNPIAAQAAGLNSFVAPPHAAIYAKTMADRLGILFKTIDYPYITDRALLHKLAILAFQRELFDAEKSGVSLAWRPLLIPNKPLYFAPRDRLALISDVSHSMTIHGECSTNVGLRYSRLRDQAGVRRFITGGAQMPISFATAPGAKSLTELKRNEVQLANRIAAAAREGKLVALPGGAGFVKLREDILKASPTSLNVVTADGTRVANLQAAFARADAEADAFLKRLEGSGVEVDGILTGLPSGVNIVGHPTPQPTSDLSSPSSAATTAPIQLPPAGDGLPPQLQNSTELGGTEVSGLDVNYLASVIANETRGLEVSDQTKAAIAWTALNAAGAKSKANTVPAGTVQQRASDGNFADEPYSPSTEDQNIARSILEGGIPDPTGGADRLAKIDADDVFGDLRACQATDSEVVFVNDHGIKGPDGRPIVDSGTTFVFIKRKAVNRGNTSRRSSGGTGGSAIPKRLEPISSFVHDAAVKYNLPEEWIYAIAMSEGGLRFDELNVNPSGDIGAMQINDINWRLFERIAPDQFVANAQWPRSVGGARGSVGGGLRLVYLLQGTRSGLFVRGSVSPRQYFTNFVPEDGPLATEHFENININDPPPLHRDIIHGIIARRDANVDIGGFILNDNFDFFSRRKPQLGQIVTSLDHATEYDVIRDNIQLDGVAVDRTVSIIYKASAAYNTGAGNVTKNLALSPPNPDATTSDNYGRRTLGHLSDMIQSQANSTAQPTLSTSEACQQGDTAAQQAVLNSLRSNSAYLDSMFKSSLP